MTSWSFPSSALRVPENSTFAPFSSVICKTPLALPLILFMLFQFSFLGYCFLRREEKTDWKTNQRILEKERRSIRGEYKRRMISISSGTKLLLPDRNHCLGWERVAAIRATEWPESQQCVPSTGASIPILRSLMALAPSYKGCSDISWGSTDNCHGLKHAELLPLISQNMTLFFYNKCRCN